MQPINTEQPTLPTTGGVSLTHPDRVIYPEQGISKRLLAAYYFGVAKRMLPHVRERVLTLVRCPRGVEGQCFFQKHRADGMPGEVAAAPIVEASGNQADYMTIRDVAGLIALVQFGTLEIHGWGARADKPERPDQLVFDLDPGEGVAWPELVRAAFAVRERLESLELLSFVKTSGGRGLHVVVPIERRLDWESAKDFCRSVAESIKSADSQRYVTTAHKAARRGRIFIDYLRNVRGATCVCPYSTRAKHGARVSTPLEWSELVDESPQSYTIEDVLARVARSEDPWEQYFAVRQSITMEMRREVGARR